MENIGGALGKILDRLIRDLDINTLVLILVIILLQWLLVKNMIQKDILVKELMQVGQTLSTLTEMIKQMVYGRKDDNDS